VRKGETSLENGKLKKNGGERAPREKKMSQSRKGRNSGEGHWKRVTVKGRVFRRPKPTKMSALLGEEKGGGCA